MGSHLVAGCQEGPSGSCPDGAGAWARVSCPISGSCPGSECRHRCCDGLQRQLKPKVISSFLILSERYAGCHQWSRCRSTGEASWALPDLLGPPRPVQSTYPWFRACGKEEALTWIQCSFSILFFFCFTQPLFWTLLRLESCYTICLMPVLLGTCQGYE